MSATLGQAYVQIMPSAQGIKGNLSRTLGGEAEAAGASSGSKFAASMKGTLAKGIAALGLGALLGKTIMAGGQLEQSIGGIETLFGTGGQTLEQFAKSAGKSVGEVRGEYKKLQAAQDLALGNAANAYKTAGLSANDYMQTVTNFAAALKKSTGSEKEAAQVADSAVIAMSDNANKMGTNMTDIQNAYQGFAKQNYTINNLMSAA